MPVIGRDGYLRGLGEPMNIFIAGKLFWKGPYNAKRDTRWAEGKTRPKWRRNCTTRKDPHQHINRWEQMGESMFRGKILKDGPSKLPLQKI